MIAVTAATGQLGRLVIAALAGRDDVVAIARDADKAADLGVPVRVADYADPAGWPAALAGVETLLLISGTNLGARVGEHTTVIEAARAAGVRRIVYTSGPHADTSTMGLMDDHRETEAVLRGAGVAFTILRNNWYTEMFADRLGGHVLRGGAGDGGIPSTSRAEFAEAAAIVLTTDGHEGRTYELTGTEAWTMADLAAFAGVAYEDLPEDAHRDALLAAGLPKPVAAMVAGIDAAIARGALGAPTGDLAAILGRDPEGWRETLAGSRATA